MSDRKAELERKKAKLQAMRDEKRRKEEDLKKKKELPVARELVPKAEAEAAAAAAEPAADSRVDADQMLADLGIPPAGGRPTQLVPPAQSDGLHAAPSAQLTTTGSKKVHLTTSKVTQTNIPPKELVTYCKETQTVIEHVEREAGCSRSHSTSVDDDNDSLDVAVDTPPSSAHAHKMPHVEMARPADTDGEQQSPPEEEEPEPVRELTEEEKQKVVMSEDFMRFFDRATRVVERALYEKIDVFTDYAGGDDEKEEGGLAEGEKLKLNRQFYDERWSKHRSITSMDWSTQHPELLVASYNNNEESPHDPDGVALIWNLKYKKSTPEFVFHCQSAVMSTCFAKFHPNLIVGGTYSGQIVLWDNRSNKRTPVQRTPLSAAAHTHPVYCVNVVGTQNAHNLISVSTDGKMCSWSLDMLSQPQDSMELQHKQSKAVACTCLSFLSADVNNFVVGSEEGAVYTACRHGSKAGINDMFEGHQGPVTGIDCQTVPGSIDFSHYFITSSFDWTVKLWNIKENRPLHSFEDNSDYVYDARWSPIHPALFATVDGTGRLDLWNINNDTEVPTASVHVDNNVALNKCRWHQAGHSIAAGDDIGRIHIYDVGEPLAVPKNDEWSRLVHTLQDLKTNQADQEEEHLTYGSSPMR